MNSKRTLLMAAVTLLAAGSLLAQGSKADALLQQQRLDAEQADATKRTALAEALIRSRETPGHEVDGAVRRALINTLKKESVKQLELRAASGNLVIAPDALGDTKADLVYTTFEQPCRVFDTRFGGGKLAAGEVRPFRVMGNNLAFQGGPAAGCNVPLGATAAMLNFVAVTPDGPGNLKGAAYLNNIPTTGSILNYQLLTPTLNIANGVLFPICDFFSNPFDCVMDLNLQANTSGTHVIGDVLGYMMRFPKEQVASFVTERWNAGTTYFVSNACVDYADTNPLSINAWVPGKVRVRGTVQLKVHHESGVCGDDTSSQYTVFIAARSDTVPVCSDWSHYASISTWNLKCGALDTGDTLVNLPLDAVFPVAAGTTSIVITGTASESTGDSAKFWYSTISAEFIPN